MQLAVPHTMEQVAVATRLLDHIPDWFVTDEALLAVGQQFPGFGHTAVLVKAAAINQLYWTRVFASGSAAQHIVNVMRESPAIDEALVERLAAVPKAPHRKQAKRYFSFASKFAHFYLSAALPIYDWYADDTIRWHLGRRAAESSSDHPYLAFAANVRTLRERAGIACSTRDLDRYLSLAGQYREHQKNKNAGIGGEVRAVFESGDAGVPEELRVLAYRMKPSHRPPLSAGAVAHHSRQEVHASGPNSASVVSGGMGSGPGVPAVALALLRRTLASPT